MDYLSVLIQYWLFDALGYKRYLMHSFFKAERIKFLSEKLKNIDIGLD